ncbi:MAG: ATP-binding protein [Euryarchaeota archaeon]|nr:ATP-binding protein [Euryarchaeota archaeon]
MTPVHDIDTLIALGEGFTTEFKRTGTSNLGREICAFANATGGVILIGVADDGKITGVGNHNELKSRVQSIARSAEPPIVIDMESVGEVLCITVPEQHSKPYSFGGKFFIREGATSQQMARNEIREFFFKEGLIHFDETPCTDYNLERDLTPEIWSRFVKHARLPEGLEPRPALDNLHLTKDGRMTHTGAWLLCDDITRYTLQAHVTCAMFRGTTKTYILDRKDFSGDLYTIYEDVIAYLQAKLNTALIPHARGRDERLELPEDALREALVNAIAHRDYRSTANVQVYIFHDRIEIVTPGGLPAGMREEDLGIKSVPRNPLLFGMFYRMGMVEQVGSGIKRIREMCIDYGVAEPLLDVSENWVTITFKRPIEEVTVEVTPQVPPQATPQVPPQVRRLLAVCDGELLREELQGRIGLADRKHFRTDYLRPALSACLIEMTIPDKPTSSKQKYRITEKGRALLAEVEEGGQE